jgi:hypothetical protein
MTVWTVLTVCYVGSRARGDLICGYRTTNQMHFEFSTAWETVRTVQTAPDRRAFDFLGETGRLPHHRRRDRRVDQGNATSNEGVDWFVILTLASRAAQGGKTGPR